MVGPKAWRLALLATVALALVVLPTVGPTKVTAQPSSLEVSIDAPGTGQPVDNGKPIEIRGWAVDTSSQEGTGITSIEISLDSQNGFASQPMIANYGLSRPDVAQVYGRQDWTQSGFSFTWTPSDLPQGPQTVRVWAHASNDVSRSSTVSVYVAQTLASIEATQTAAPPVPTPTNTPLPGGLRVEDNIFNCSIDLTLLAPASFSSRGCPPTRTVTSTATATAPPLR
jgi:hypothetical protein